jgi:hypothetical protein
LQVVDLIPIGRKQQKQKSKQITKAIIKQQQSLKSSENDVQEPAQKRLHIN